MTRRSLLAGLILGSAGAGAGVVLDRMGALGATGGRSRRPWWDGPHSSANSLPQLAAVANLTHDGQARIFQSEPHLRPPAITVDVRAHGVAPGLILTDVHSGSAYQGPMIMDGTGELLWFLPLSPGSDTGLRAFNFRVQSLAGKPVLTWFQGAVVSGHGVGHYELWDSSYTQVAQVTGQNGYQGDLHEFVLTPQGTALFTCYGQATADLSKFGGETNGSYFYGVVQEVDVATGKLLFEWRSDQYVSFEESYEPLTYKTLPWDYFHVNSICVDPSDGNLIISGRNAWAFYKVDRSTGKVLWQAGGKSSDFKLSAGARFAFQHDVEVYPGGQVTIFDNEGGPPVEASQSRGLFLALDEKARTLDFVAQIEHTPPVLSQALGNVQPLPDGHRFMGWGTSSYLTEYGPNDETVLFDARFPPLTESYRAFKQEWSGQPKGAVPAIAVAGGATTRVYCSFNGCTAVDGWVVLGGSSPTKLAPLGRADRLGFETVITVPHPPAYVAVEAMGSGGHVLGRSPAVAAR